MDRRIIVALDVPQRERAIELARRLAPEVAMVKVGLEAFVAHGPDLVRELRSLGVEVFLDLKLHDIPRTAAAATQMAAGLDVTLLTIHAAGGAEMVRAVADAAEGRTRVIAVTALTSLDSAAVRTLGVQEPASQWAQRLGALAIHSGADGLVCSAHELGVLEPVGGLRVVPGVRPTGIAHGDQKRVATPAEAVSSGATWIVVGRPILEAADPAAAAAAINQQVAGIAARGEQR